MKLNLIWMTFAFSSWLWLWLCTMWEVGSFDEQISLIWIDKANVYLYARSLVACSILRMYCRQSEPKLSVCTSQYIYRYSKVFSALTIYTSYHWHRQMNERNHFFYFCIRTDSIFSFIIYGWINEFMNASCAAHMLPFITKIHYFTFLKFNIF